MDDLEGFMQTLHLFAQLSISFSAIWNVLEPELKEGVCRIKAKSSANKSVFVEGCWGMSWKYILNRKGARMLP